MLVALMFIGIFACQPSLPLSGDLPIHAPTYLQTGEPIHVTVGPVEVTDGTNIGLVMVGKHGPRVYQSQFIAGIAVFNIPKEHTLQAGSFAFIAASQNARGEAALRLNPSKVRKLKA